MSSKRNVRRIGLAAALCCGVWTASLSAEDVLLADGRAWPGRMLTAQAGRVDLFFTRGGSLPDGAVPRVQSLTTLPSGQVVSCSGLDRMIFELVPGGERVVHQGGYLARQVRTDRDGTVYWSGLETPLDNNPLPDGFIYSWNPSTSETRTVLTFSQGDVNHDWWGAFDVRDGRVLVGTFHHPTRIYDVSVSPVALVYELPLAATAFRHAQDGSLWACDGQGKLFRFADATRPEHPETIVDTPTAFVDFAFGRPPAR